MTKLLHRKFEFFKCAGQGCFKQGQKLHTILAPAIENLLLKKLPTPKANKETPNKRQKQEGDLVPEENTTIDQSIKKHYADNFSTLIHKLVDLPSLEGKKICARYHLSGVCKEGQCCYRSSTHKKLPNSKQKELKDWIEKHAGAVTSI